MYMCMYANHGRHVHEFDVKCFVTLHLVVVDDQDLDLLLSLARPKQDCAGLQLETRRRGWI